MIEYEDFEKLDIRMGKILEAEKIENADKLIRLMIDTGDDVPRQVLAGIAKWYLVEDLIGKIVPVLCNLAPRTLRGYESNGMILAAGGAERAYILTPEEDVEPGSKVR